MKADEFFNQATILGLVRERSPEMDFGVWWRPEARTLASGPTFRISCVQVTGEIYCRDMSKQNGDVFVLGQVRPGKAAYEEAEELLTGWADVCGQNGSLGWARHRLRRDADLDELAQEVVVPFGELRRSGFKA